MGSLTPPKPIALRLPAELWDVILLEHTPREHVQRTALSLLIVFPTAPVSHLSLWRHLVVARPEQLLPLYQLVRPLEARESEECRAVRSFEMRSWRGDPDILNNTLGVLSGVRELHLRVGTNWAPEHLEDSLAKRRPKLEQLSIQWRPYVEKPSYYIFLSGNYYDSSLDRLSAWDVSEEGTNLRVLSLVQDVPPRHLVDESVAAPVVAPHQADNKKEQERVMGRGNYTGHGPFSYLSDRLLAAQPKHFAQPIVLFNLSCLTRLATSPVATGITHLRLRIPLRDLVTPLTQLGGAVRPPFPALAFLDLSTTNVRLQTHLPLLLGAFPSLEHLVADHSNMFGFLGRDREKGRECCVEAGKLVAMFGMGRGKEAEREVARWEREAAERREARRERERREEEEEEERRREEKEREAEEEEREAEEEERDEGERGHGPGVARPVAPSYSSASLGQTSSGRKSGRADALASRLEALTTEEYDPAGMSARACRKGAKAMNKATFSIRPTVYIIPATSSPSSSSSRSSANAPPPSSIAFVLPAVPQLKTFSLGGEAPLSVQQRAEWVDAFEEGWTDGVERLVKWAVEGVGARFERARRKAEGERVEWERRARGEGPAGGSAGGTGGAKAKGKGRAAAAALSEDAMPPSAMPPPPPTILLYRFRTSADPPPDSTDATAEEDRLEPGTRPSPASRLIPVDPDSDWRSLYTSLLPEADVEDDEVVKRSCVFCPVAAHAEGGPLRRGGEDVGVGQGLAAKKRGEGAGVHEVGCGHGKAREVWGEEGMP